MEQQVNQRSENHDFTRIQDWDPKAILKNMSFLEQKIHQLQELVRIIFDHRSLVGIQGNDLSSQQQQLITADLTSIIVQLISTAGSLLPTVKHHTFSSASPTTKQPAQFGGVSVPSEKGINAGALPHSVNVTKAEDQSNHVDLMGDCGIEQKYAADEHEANDEDEFHEEENLPPGSYEILQLEKEEILAPHTHFCTICGKGFKRDANLRMHMRGHGDEYKTPAALAQPHKDPSSRTMTLIKRYSCPCVGCKRNKEHKRFQPLKTISCVKKHYRRTHCEKSYACSRCNLKKFSVIADLRTHEKHCGKDKWLCSCGTTFSRKDKLFRHISLFQGHTPAIPLEETKGFAETSDQGHTGKATTEAGGIGCELNVQNGSGLQNTINVKEDADNPGSYLSPLNIETSKLSELQEFPRPPFEDPENSFSFLLSGSCNYPRRLEKYRFY
ncbi:protein SENSITIVE TO PROTON RHIZOTOXICITY 1-like [Nicotiana tabacum]|uniref:Protein SENSITIVE TO PROTON RHIZOTOXICITY 1-like n=2 Tax=Nicotiana tabacum TaxID=4097 RepID=A0A1S4CPT4_TOBAC|nr:PREDICTED: protein SENSITIVE TO PROTON RHIZOTOXICITY 1-like [Nicotiana tabacum]